MSQIGTEGRRQLQPSLFWIIFWPASVWIAGFAAGIVIGILLIPVMMNDPNALDPAYMENLVLAWLPGILALAYIGLGWIFLRWTRSRGLASATSSFWPRLALPETLLGLALTFCVMVGGGHIVLTLSQYFQAPGAEANIVSATSWNLSLLMSLISVGLIGPYVEEVIFRGWLLPVLRHRGAGILGALVISSAGFALLHVMNGGLLPVIYTFILGLGCGLARLISGRLWAPVLIHVINNCIVVLNQAGLLTSQAGN